MKREQVQMPESDMDLTSLKEIQNLREGGQEGAIQLGTAWLSLEVGFSPKWTGGLFSLIQYDINSLSLGVQNVQEKKKDIRTAEAQMTQF